MASLLVRNVDEALIQNLRAQAFAHGRSAEAEHRAILDRALRQPQPRSFSEVLSQMPNVGRDEDFVRPDDSNKVADVFG